MFALRSTTCGQCHALSLYVAVIIAFLPLYSASTTPKDLLKRFETLQWTLIVSSSQMYTKRYTKPKIIFFKFCWEHAVAAYNVGEKRGRRLFCRLKREVSSSDALVPRAQCVFFQKYFFVLLSFCFLFNFSLAPCAYTKAVSLPALFKVFSERASCSSSVQRVPRYKSTRIIVTVSWAQK